MDTLCSTDRCQSTAAAIKEFQTNANPGIDVLKHESTLWRTY